MNSSYRGVTPYMATKPDYKTTILQASLPNYAIIPLFNLDNRRATALVKPGDGVREGQVIGIEGGNHSVHASIPGVVHETMPLDLPGNVTCLAIKIKLGGKFNYTGKYVRGFHWESLSSEELINKVKEAGLVQLDGSADDLSSVLKRCRESGVHTIVANAASGTPFLSSEIRILQEHPEKIVRALEILQHILTVNNIFLAFTKPAHAFLELAAKKGIHIKTKRLPEVYPAGDASELMYHFSRKGASLQAFNISTLLALYEGIVLEKALIDKVITVGGGALVRSRTMRVRFGTPLSAVLQEVGGLKETPAKIVSGIPLQGHEITDINTPITRYTTSIFALQKDELAEAFQLPCINCGTCVDHCPANLEPLILYKLLNNNRHEEALDRGLMSCWLCGICSHVCPSHIPLTKIIESGMGKKGELIVR